MWTQYTIIAVMYWIHLDQYSFFELTARALRQQMIGQDSGKITEHLPKQLLEEKQNNVL